MKSLTSRPREVEKKKRWVFFGTEAAGALAALFMTPWLGVPIMAVGAYLGWDWFKYRAKYGMRF